MTYLKHISLAFALLVFSVKISTDAQDYTTAMKVRYIKSFTKYVEWPSSYKSGDFIIGVLNDQKIADALTIKLKDRNIGIQPYKVVNFSSTSDIAKCHLLYIPTKQSSSLAGAVGKVDSWSTLIISDSPGLIEKGSSINLVMQGPKQVFELNKKTMSKYSLTVSAQLEPMASRVIN